MMNEEIELFRGDLTALEKRNKIYEFGKYLRTIPEAMIGDSPEYLAINPLTHSFADGCYIREIFLKAKQLFVTKIHKIKHPFFFLKGDVSVLTFNGTQRIKAPYHGITPAGTQRIIYTHEDSIWVTVHITKEHDLKKIEEEIIAKDWTEMDKFLEANKMEGESK